MAPVVDLKSIACSLCRNNPIHKPLLNDTLEAYLRGGASASDVINNTGVNGGRGGGALSYRTSPLEYLIHRALVDIITNENTNSTNSREGGGWGGVRGVGAGRHVESQTERDARDKHALLYIVVVLLFYSSGIIIAMVMYLKREKKDMEEEKACEDYSQFLCQPDRLARRFRVQKTIDHLHKVCLSL